jgi:hypothetical protein
MDLWIRSQDGKKISKINEDLIVVGNTIRKLYNDETSFMDLATYAKEERALEVLDEVETLLKPRFMITENKELVQQENGSYYCPPLKEIEIPPQDTIFYEMPKE